MHDRTFSTETLLIVYDSLEETEESPLDVLDIMSRCFLYQAEKNGDR